MKKYNFINPAIINSEIDKLTPEIAESLTKASYKAQNELMQLIKPACIQKLCQPLYDNVREAAKRRINSIISAQHPVLREQLLLGFMEGFVQIVAMHMNGMHNSLDSDHIDRLLRNAWYEYEDCLKATKHSETQA